MSEITFRDTVRHIQKLDNEPKYELTFRRKAAFYWIADDQGAAVAALQTSAVTKSPVEVVAVATEIRSAILAT